MIVTGIHAAGDELAPTEHRVGRNKEPGADDGPPVPRCRRGAEHRRDREQIGDHRWAEHRCSYSGGDDDATSDADTETATITTPDQEPDPRPAFTRRQPDGVRDVGEQERHEPRHEPAVAEQQEHVAGERTHECDARTRRVRPDRPDRASPRHRSARAARAASTTARSADEWDRADSTNSPRGDSKHRRKPPRHIRHRPASATDGDRCPSGVRSWAEEALDVGSARREATTLPRGNEELSRRSDRRISALRLSRRRCRRPTACRRR